MDSFFSQWIDNQAGTSLANNQHSILLVNNQYSPDVDTHSVRGDIPVTAIVAETNLQNQTFVNGSFSFDDVVFTNVAASAATLTSLIVIDNVTQNLVAVLQNVTGISIAPNGNDLTLSLDACGLFSI